MLFWDSRPWSVHPIGILPHPRQSRDMPFKACRKRVRLDLLRAFGLARDALLRIAQTPTSLRSGRC